MSEKSSDTPSPMLARAGPPAQREESPSGLPDDPQEAFHKLANYVMQGRHIAIFQLLNGNCISDLLPHSISEHEMTLSGNTDTEESSTRSIISRAKPQMKTSQSGKKMVPYFDINYPGSRHGQTLLHVSVENLQYKVSKILLELGADPNKKDDDNRTPLHLASEFNSSKTLRLLIQLGGCTYFPDKEGRLPIHWAAASGSLACLKLLFGNPNDVFKHTFSGLTLLHLGARSGQYDIVNFLIKERTMKCLINKADNKGETPIVLAVARGCRDIVKLLIQHGAKVKSRSKTGVSILEMCISKKMFYEAALIARKYDTNDSWVHCLAPSIELGHLAVNLLEEFFEYLFENNPAMVWDLWNDLRNVVIECAQGMSHETRPAHSFATLVRLLRFLRDNGTTLLDAAVTSKRPLSKRIISTSSTSTRQHEERAIARQTIDLEPQTLNSHGEPSRVNTFSVLDDVWKFLGKWMSVVRSYHSRTTSHRHMRHSLNTEDLRHCAPLICSLVKGYHLWTVGTPSYPEFLEFISRFGVVIRLFLVFNAELIFDSLDFLFETPEAMLEFQNIRSVVYDVTLVLRKAWFYERLYQGTPPDSPDYLSEHLNLLVIDRDDLFTTSCEQVMNSADEFLRGSLTVNFEGEDGMGVGVRREWFNMILDHITNPRFGLFQVCNNGLNFQPVHHSIVNPDHPKQFEFAGKMIALLIYYKSTTGVHFTRSFYKEMLGEPLDFTDVAGIDGDLANSLHWMLDNDISDMVELTFCVDRDDLGEAKVIELKPGGQDIVVTEENKVEYVRLLSEYKMSGAIKSQIESFLKGFYSIIPRKLLAVFTPAELELILCGLNIIDRRDFRGNVKYSGYESTDDIIKWFWEVVDSYSQDDLMNLLRFITGYTRVPHGGFSQLAEIGSSGPIKIVKGNGDDNSLPHSSVCFNMLLLPPYTNKDALKSKLTLAITYGSGFDNC